MSKQIFRKYINPELLFALLEEICLKTDKYYLIDNTAYRKMIYKELHIPFCDSIRDNYHVSKQFYVDRKMSYNSFINIVRQICKTNNVMFTSQIKYNESKYNIDYLIYFGSVDVTSPTPEPNNDTPQT